MEMQNSAHLYYQKNKTTKLAWQKDWLVQDACGLW
jgi:hypothetical protein